MSDDRRPTVKRARELVNRRPVPLTHGRLGLWDFTRRVVQEIQRDHVGAFAASVAFRGLLAIFPFLILSLTLLGIFQSGELMQTAIDKAAPALPGEAITLLRDQVQRLTDPTQGSLLSISALTSLAVALWAVSGGMRSIMEALNVMYDVPEGRSFAYRYLWSFLIAALAVVFFLTSLILVVAGTDIAQLVGDRIGGAPGEAVEAAWSIVQWPLLFALVVVAIALIYYWAPAAEQELRFITPGSMLAATSWLAFSLLFALYVDNLGNYNATYGAIASVVVLMLYLYFTSFLLLVGAEVNQVIEDAHPEGKRSGEMRPGQPAPAEGTKAGGSA